MISSKRHRRGTSSSSPFPLWNPRIKSALLAICLLVLLGDAVPVVAQIRGGNSYPDAAYYVALRDYYGGAFNSAERGFNRALKSNLSIGNKRWIDSVCTYSMLGELAYRRGNLKTSLQLHEAALEVFLVNQDWMNRLRYPPMAASNDRIQARINWGTRNTVMGALPDSMSSQEGNDVVQSFQTGGAVNPAHMRSIDAVEVARCLAVSLRRRALLLGQTTALSPMSSKLSNAVSNTNAPSNHWAASWVEVLFGLAQLNEGLWQEAVAHLSTGAVYGNYDHPLTAIALLEIGRYHLRKREYVVAMNHLHQASLAAARYRQADLVEEAMLLMTDAFLANDGRGAYPSVAAAILYANREEFFRLATSLQMMSAEVAYYANDNAQAIGLLQQARAVLLRSRQFATDLGTRWNYLDALTKYRAGNHGPARKSLQAAIAQRQSSSLRTFHLLMVESLRTAGRRVMGPQELEILYSRLLAEPTERQWRTEPLETMSWMLTDRTPSMTIWFELLVKSKEHKKALAVAEQLKRNRFYRSLPMGGRLLSLRWLLEGEASLLGKRFTKVQQNLRQRYPQTQQLSRQAERIQAELRQLPLVPEDDEKRSVQKKLVAELAATSNQQESLVREIALRRESAPLVFPPQPSHSAIQNALQQNQAVLMFVTTSKGWHVWFIRKDSEEYWPIRAPKVVRRQIGELLRSIGCRKPDSKVSAKDLDDEDWKKTSRGLWKAIVGELPSNGWDGLDEIVVVPDGPLWYLPFELLRVPADQLEDTDEDESLLSLVRIRYAPLASLSVGERRDHNQDLRTTIVGGKLYPNESNEYAREMLERLKAAYPDLEVIAKDKPLGTSSALAGSLNRLIVWNDIVRSAGEPYDWSPAQYDRKSKSGQLSDWLEYPWGAPDQVILPGFHTLAERGLTRNANGQEVFLSLCALMSTGTRTVLLSRWRTGGRMPTILVREFASELPASAASAAWQHAVQIARGDSLNAEAEPRVSAGSDTPEEISADHPFFWSGYMLVDTGSEPKEGEPKEGEPKEGEPKEGEPKEGEPKVAADEANNLVEGEDVGEELGEDHPAPADEGGSGAGEEPPAEPMPDV